jgi:pimeloyl-ACP methyl ester carboxylesterase
MPFIFINGIKLHYEERGTGTPLLLLMGITAPGSAWAKHVEFWQDKFRCLMPDNRGVGLSDKPPGPYDSATMADDMAGLLTQLGIEQVQVVGCSMGSIIAQQLALRHPGRVRGLVLLSPWARLDAYSKAVFEHLITAKARLQPEEFTRFIQLLIFAKDTWDSPFWAEEMEAACKTAALESEPQPPQAMAAQAAACLTHNLLAELGSIRCPTLVMGGASDIFTPPWMGRELADAIPGATLHLYPGAGHAFHWERIDDFNTRVCNWLMTNTGR